MAEFKNVVAQFERMCKHYVLTVGCDDCPLFKNGCTEGSMPVYPLDKLEEYEKIVMDWAAKNPEPVYPTWGDWLASQNIIVYGYDKDAPYYERGDGSRLYFNNVIVSTPKMWMPIPADIAEKLGIEPKEG